MDDLFPRLGPYVEMTAERLYAFMDHFTQLTYPRLPVFLFGQSMGGGANDLMFQFDVDVELAGVYDIDDDEEDGDEDDVDSASPKPTPADTLRSLERIPAAAHPADTCIVCAGEEMDASWLRMHACGHLLHEACVLPWLDSHDTCPVCMSPIRARQECNPQT